MLDIDSELLGRFIRAVGPEPDETLAQLEAENRDRDFPMIGPEVGPLLGVFARMVDARRVFEFGSGLGYSAYWFARALPEDGQIVLTDYDADELDKAREFLERGELADRAAFESGDALETVARYDGPFDIVLIDLDKDLYVDAFEAVREKVTSGGIVIADNMLRAGSVDPEGVVAAVEGHPLDEMGAGTRGIADYLSAIRANPDFEVVGLPVGNGITVAVKQ